MDLIPGATVVASSWLNIKREAEKLNRACVDTRLPSSLAGGYIYTGYENRIQIDLRYSVPDESVGENGTFNVAIE